MVRLSAGGRNDPTYGHGGTIRQRDSGFLAAVLQPDDRLVVVDPYRYYPDSDVRRFLP